MPATVSNIVDWRKRAAIVAHPYAPMGGCYDDPVVDVVAATILKQGYIVGTFNFR
jgi:alpha/beta superfamily hydrolase